ncbi:ABC transporter substrate-binding protein [Microtetraspora sp. NBRC 16547]|uniref:peptide ABC transporter substrate-binding protein n=1 Tax=Microtetraspora sp. NBRC 16547 TaxID=3030993 RepID=UPI0024A30159|nr:ABC transporter substrate-binding protein [Microtetraspora sp. NBRC 16547]GLW97436.1 peptide ABC transporter substrate-binding protein [Microtetraspora sp. NBRC 16547]
MRVAKGAQIAAGTALLALGVAACGGGGSGSGGSDGGTNPRAAESTVYIRGCEPQTGFVPGNINETCGGTINGFVYDRLVKYNSDTAAPELNQAESIETSDNKVWTIKLKPGLKWSDGSPVTAKNYVDAWNYTAYSPNAQIGTSWFEGVEGYDDVATQDPDGPDGPKKAPEPKKDTMSGLEVIDDLTFKVTLKAPEAVFRTKLGYTTFAALPEAFFKDPTAFKDNPVTNGPFKFVKWDHNSQIVVEANPDYPGAEKPKVKKIVYKMYKDDDAAYADLVSNNLDFTELVPPSALAGDKWKSDLGDRAIEGQQGVIQTLTVALYDKKYGGNADFRKALSMAIDRKTITDKIFNKGRVPLDGWISPLVDGYKSPGACGELCTFDPAKAKEYLAKAKAAGYTPPAEYPLWYNGDSAHKEWVDATANSINQALGADSGFKVVGKATPTFAELRDMATTHKVTGMLRTGWQMDYPHIENFLNPLYKTGSSSNDGLFSDKELDAKLREGDTNADPAQSIAAYQAAEAMMVKEMPVIPLWSFGLQAGTSKWVTGVKVTPFGELDPLSIAIK